MHLSLHHLYIYIVHVWKEDIYTIFLAQVITMDEILVSATQKYSF